MYESVHTMKLDKNTLCFYLSTSAAIIEGPITDFFSVWCMSNSYAIVSLMDKEISIGFIWIPEHLRGQGRATTLLEYIKKFGNDLGVYSINLDDCTDMFCKKTNLYIRSGFSYVSEGHPEMILITQNSRQI